MKAAPSKPRRQPATPGVSRGIRKKRMRYRSCRGVVTQPKPAKNGYSKVGSNGDLIHRLVCHAFHGAPPSAAHTQVDHIDGDPSNNRRENLRWVTRSQNIRHSYATNLARASNAWRRSKPVLGRKRRRASGGTAADALGLDSGHIRACCSGKRQQTGGYEFRLDAEAAAPELLEGEEWRDIALVHRGEL